MLAFQYGYFGRGSRNVILLLIGFVDYDERGLARETAPAAPAPGATGCYEDVSKSSNCFLLFFINDFYPSD